VSFNECPSMIYGYLSYYKNWELWKFLWQKLNKKLSYRQRTERCIVSDEISQLPRNSAETTCTTSPEQIEVMKLKRYSKAMCNKHVHSTMTRSIHFRCPVGVINKPTTVKLWISPVYQRLAVAKFSKSTIYKLLTWPWPRPLREHSLITRLRLRMADSHTKFEVSSASCCREITWGVKF